MKKRIRTKGHYRSVEWDEKGRFVKAEKWSSKYFKCDNPDCGELTLNEKGYAIAIIGGPILNLCPKCFKSRGSLLSTTKETEK